MNDTDDTNERGRRPGRPPEDRALELLTASARLRARVEDMVLEHRSRRPTPGFRLVGEGLEQIDAGLTALEPTARTSVWTMHPVLFWDPQNPMTDLDEQTRGRGLDMCLITGERTAGAYPLISSEMPHVRFGPAPSGFLLIDGTTAVVGGPPSDDGYPTAWLTTRGDVVALVRAVWDAARPLSRPGVPDGADPPFTARQCRVARRMVMGAKDAAIARELGVSVRTVAAEVAALLLGLGVASRAEAALVLRGGSDREAAGRRRPDRGHPR